LAEGREPQADRTGINFVYNNPEDWCDSSCFVFRTNIYETALHIIRELISNNPLGIEYFYVVDSIHAMIAKSESEKGFEDAAKVASGATLATHFLKTVTLPSIHGNHIGILILQKRSSIKINPYEKGDPKIIDTSAAHSLLHFASWIFEIGHRWNDDYFLEDKNDKKSKRIGHNCIVTLKKSQNETTGTTFKIPIFYKRKNNTAIWVEREIFDMLLAWSLIKRESNQGSFILNSDILSEIKQIDSECPDKFRTQERVEEYLESKPDVTRFLFDKFKKMISS
jgi:RecA/RadA recombinase